MTELDEKIDALAKKASSTHLESSEDYAKVLVIKKAIYAGIRAFAEQEPSSDACLLGMAAYEEFGTPITRYRAIYKAMLAEALKALD